MKYIFILFSFMAYAENEIPRWVTSPSNADENYYYGFGMAESENESTAFSEADKNAESDLIQNAFGASFQVSTEMKADNVAVNLKKTLSSESNQVLTKNIQRDQIYKENPKRSLYKIYILKKIDKKIADTFSAETIHTLSKSHFESNPSGATVNIDGKVLGTTPLTALLPSGSYKIKMNLNGYKSISRKLIIGSKSDSTMTIDFEKQMGSIELEIEPSSSSVLLDNEAIESSRTTFDLKPGKHHIKVSADGYTSKEKSFTVEADKKLTLSIQLAQIKVAPSKPQKPSKSYEQIFSEKANNLYSRGKYAAIIKYANDEAPNTWVRAFYLAMAYSELAIHDKAIENIKHASTHYRGTNFLTNYCSILSAAGNHKEALQKCDEAILDDPSNVEPYVIKARTCFNAAEKYYGMREEYTEKGIDFYLAASKLNRRYRNELYNNCHRYPFNWTLACSRY